MMNRKKLGARKPAAKPGARKVSKATRSAAKKTAGVKTAKKKAAGKPVAKRPAAQETAPRKAAAKRPAKKVAKKGTKKLANIVARKVAKKTSPKAVVRTAAPRRHVRSKPALDSRRLRNSFLEIVRRTSADLPPDVVRGIEAGRAKEEPGSNASWAMNVIVENIDLARDLSAPLCQDTGSILFYIRAPRGFDETTITRAAAEAVAEATAKGYLRQNSVDSLTGRNTGNNLGPGSPTFHIHQWGTPDLEVRLVLKGGGCENVGAQYSLPDTRLGADRDLAGVEKCLLDAAYQAQGKGCGPGILGACIGGDRATGYGHSKEQLLRPLDDTNSIPELAALETRVIEEANRLGIGPMGFGGSTTLLGCKVGTLNRLPASFFVSISYMCWAYRRQGAVLTPDGSIREWLY